MAASGCAYAADTSPPARYHFLMSTILDDIVHHKRQEIADARARVSADDLERRARAMPPVRDFRAALERGPGVQVIAEVKKASPSVGLIRADFDPVVIARTYAANGAACISVLTDERFFQGHLRYLEAIRAAVDVPLLRKDFILDRHQLLEARIAGADCVLLIAEILPGKELASLFEQATDLGLQALVELYEADNLPRVLDAGARLVGINNRDLRAQKVRLAHTIELAPRVPAGVCLVGESGITTHADVERMRAAGVKAVLVGETLMRSADVGAALRALRGQP
jgi:indole-3-glycerol phosphate synthase